MTADIRCPACGRESWLLRTPKYDGFRRVGEELKCAACGHVFESESDVPTAARPKPSIFTDDDRPAAPALFRGEAPPAFCHRCRHYVVHPFRQWCGRHKKEVEATDTCNQFEARPLDEPADGPPLAGPDRQADA